MGKEREEEIAEKSKFDPTDGEAPQSELSARIGREQTDEAFVEEYDPFKEVRELIEKGDFALAQEKLDGFEEHSAEWHYSYAQIFRKKNWLSEYRKSLTSAIALDPQNEIYRKELEELEKMADSGKKARKKRKKSERRLGANGDTAGVCAEGACECCGMVGCEVCCSALCDGCS